MTSPNETENKKSAPGVFFWPALALGLLGLVVALYHPVLKGQPILEKDYLWLSAGKSGAEWLPYMNHLSDLFERPVLQAIGAIRPGTWFYHVGMGFVFPDNPKGYFFVQMVLLALCGWMLGMLCYLLTERKIAAVVAAALFVTHPQLTGVMGTITSGPALVSLAWLLFACISFYRYKTDGRFLQLIPPVCAVFLSYSTHEIGFAAIGAIFFMDIITLPRKRNWKHLVALFGRQFLFVAPVLAFVLFWFSIGGAMELIRLYVAVIQVKPLLFSMGAGLKGLLFPLPPASVANALTRVLTSDYLVLFLVPVIFGVAVASVMNNKKRLFAFMLILVGLSAQGANLISLRSFSPEYSLLFLVSVAGLALLLGDLLPLIPPKSAGIAAVFTLVCLYCASTMLGASWWAEKGKNVGRMADKLEKIYGGLGDTADVFILGYGKNPEPLLAAHLNFVMRHGINKMTRFSLLSQGVIFPGSKHRPIGQSPQGFTRLVYDDSMTFIGWGTANDLENLTGLVKKKVEKADERIRKEKVLPLTWKLGTKNLISKWNVNMDPGELIPIDDPEDIAWYVEGEIVHLHPNAGRYLK